MKHWMWAFVWSVSTLSLAAPEPGLYPGGLARIALPDGVESATFKGLPVWIQNGVAYVGIPLDEKPGASGVKTDRGDWLPFQIQDRGYPTQHIQLANRQQVSPNTQNLKRIRREASEQANWYRRFSPWMPEFPFALPAQGRVSGEFGRRRVFNGQPRRPHSGIDIAAPTGTPVLAPSAGQVIGVGDYFFNGKTLFLDHGQGLISMFCHLSEIDAAIGDWAERGDPVAKIGSTGRSTGPHLHWTVSLNNARIEPHLFMPKLSELPRK